MKNEDVLARVRDHVRAERADDPGLEAIARGESAGALEERAEGDAEVRRMVEASRPFGDEVVERIVGRVTGEASASARAKASASAKADAKGRGRVVAFVRRAAVVVGPLAMAAGVVLYVARGGEKSGHAALPEYGYVANGEMEMRGEGDARALRLRGTPSAEFEIVARPATQAGVKVVAFVFAMGDGEPSAVQAKVDIAEEGSVRIRGRARELDGAREVRVVLGAASDFTRYEDAVSRARDGTSSAQVRVLTIPVVRGVRVQP